MSKLPARNQQQDHARASGPSSGTRLLRHCSRDANRRGVCSYGTRKGNGSTSRSRIDQQRNCHTDEDKPEHGKGVSPHRNGEDGGLHAFGYFGQSDRAKRIVTITDEVSSSANPFEHFTGCSPRVIILARETNKRARASTTPSLSGVTGIARASSALFGFGNGDGWASGRTRAKRKPRWTLRDESTPDEAVIAGAM